ALKTTNRLDVLDTADNLQRVVELIDEEQSHTGQQRLVREFRLRHTRAAEVMETLQTLLGIEPKSNQPVDPRQAMMALQMAQQQAQQQGQPGGQPPPKKDKESQLYLAVNSRENSILANAPPDKMAIIEQAILVVDVSQDAATGLLANIHKMQVYRLAGVTPEALVKVLKELGSLDPTTRLEIDQKNRAIIAYAPLADHVLIRSLVDKLDGTGRRFEVIQLRVLGAEYVAGSINTLMNGPEKTDNNRNRYPFYYYMDGGGSSQQQDAADRFQVEADIEHNRLLLRANDIELAEVKTLLMKLGEIAPEGRNGHTTRVIPASPGEETEKLLERLQRVWPSVAPNPLDVDSGDAEPGDVEPRAEPTDESGEGRRKPLTKRPLNKTRGKTQPEASRPVRKRSEPEARRQPADGRALEGPRYYFAQDSRAKPDENEQPAEDEAVDKPSDPSNREENVADDAESPAKEERPSDDSAGNSTAAEDEPAAESNDEAAEMEDEPEAIDDETTLPRAGDLPLGPRPELPREAHAPVKITVGPYGMIISSAATEAPERLEDLMVDIMPPR